MPEETYFLITSRLGFRCWSAEDFEIAFELWSDPRVSSLFGGPFSEEQVRRRLENEMSSVREQGIQYWPIFLLESGEHVGCCGLRPYKPGIPELGCHLRPAFWRMGLAEETGRAVIEYAWHPLGYEELFAGHHPANGASKRLLERIGFRYTGDEMYGPTQMMHPGYRLRKIDAVRSAGACG